MDWFVALGLFVSFAAWIAIHIALTVGLASNAPRWQSLLCLVPPAALAAPYWGFRAGLVWRSVWWTATAASYVLFRVLAHR